MAKRELNEKQKRFCDEYLVDLNATQAAIRAGYSKKTAAQIAMVNLRKPLIKEFIDKRMAEKEDALIAKQDEVMKYLTSVMRREKSEHVVVTLSKENSFYAPDENGTMRKNTVKEEIPQIVEIPAQLKDSNKAAELIGKRYALFKDKVELNVKPVVIDGGDDLED